MAKQTKRYVSGTVAGSLQSNHGATARDTLRERKLSPVFFARYYPIVYELVPVSADDLKPQKHAAKAAGGE